MKLEDFKNDNYNEENSSDGNYIEFSQELDFEMNNPDSSSERTIEYSLDSNQLIIMIGSQTCPINCKDFLILKLLNSSLNWAFFFF